MPKKSVKKARPNATDAQSLIGRIVRLSWIDSAREEGWTRDAPECAAQLRCHSIGRVFDANDETITLAGHWTEEAHPQRCGGMTIPRVAVTAVRVLE